MKSAGKAELYRQLPSVDELARTPQLADLAAAHGSPALVEAARDLLSALRREIDEGRHDQVGLQAVLVDLSDRVASQLKKNLGYSLRPVINATGVILHTNLGRAPLPTAARDHLGEVATTYSNLEFDLSRGERGRRDVHVDSLFRQLFDRESRSSGRELATIVVNNNAAAVLLVLNTLAEGGEVIVSRGELVEIGGSFRIPDVMAKSHAILNEVGTTNRTRVSDYADAINSNTRALLRVHRSNFEVSGFTEQPPLPKLAELSRLKGIPLVEDLGSGSLFDLRSVGITGEPGVIDSLRAGVDVVTYSGDKLLGGPQAGILTGRPDLISRCRSNSLFRALRVDKLIYAALAATILAYIRQDYDSIPAVRALKMPADEIRRRVDALLHQLPAGSVRFSMQPGESVIGGGAAPSSVLPTVLLALEAEGWAADEIIGTLRLNDPPIIARVENGKVLLDLRTVFPAQDSSIVMALSNLASAAKTPGQDRAAHPHS
jgi:L-seryl-tRNA(Ser) seleniumtransferase